MKFENEKELEDLIVESSEKYGICRITNVNNKMFRQFYLPGYGTIDILGVYVYCGVDTYYIELTIYELKQYDIKSCDVSQISRYYRGLIRYISKTRNVFFNYDGSTDNIKIKYRGKNIRAEITVRGILVGSGYSKNDENVCFLVDSIPWLECYHFELSFDGLIFNKSSGWYNPGEKTEKNKFEEKISKEIKRQAKKSFIEELRCKKSPKC